MFDNGLRNKSAENFNCDVDMLYHSQSKEDRET